MLAAVAPGCGSDSAAPDGDRQRAPVASRPDPREQVLLSLPKMGTLFASCGGEGARRLRYRAGGVTEILSGRVGTRRLGRRFLADEDFRFVVPAVDRSGRSETIRLAIKQTSKLYDIRVRVVMTLERSEDGTGECVARTAQVRLRTAFH